MKIELRRQEWPGATAPPREMFELRITQVRRGPRYRGSPSHKFACAAEGLHDVALNSRLKGVKVRTLTARGGHTSGIVISNVPLSSPPPSKGDRNTPVSRKLK